MPKVSVIVPVYNVEKYLGECLDSVLGQTLEDIEVICVDDGSTDGSAAILADYAAKDQRIRLMSSDHGGAYVARRRGLSAATGEYVHFMDSDDIMTRNAYRELYDLAAAKGLDHVIFSAKVFCDREMGSRLNAHARSLQRYYTISPEVAGKCMGGQELFETLVEHKCFHVTPPLRIIRRSVLASGKYGFPDAKSRADNYFSAVTLNLSGLACAVTAQYSLHRVRGDSVTTGGDAPERHMRNLAVVIAHLCAFGPFADRLHDCESPTAHYIAIIARQFTTWALRIPSEQRLDAVRSVMSDLDDDARANVMNALLLAVRAFRRRPKPSVRSMVSALLSCLAAKIAGRKERWWL